MIDQRNRPAILGSLIGGVAAFVILWLIGLSPLLAWMAGWSIPAFAAYGIDKRQARAGGWRIPEAVLHGLALVGGVIGAWAGRIVFRHKTQKRSFTIVLVLSSLVWGIIAVWVVVEAVAVASQMAGFEHPHWVRADSDDPAPIW